MPLTDPSKRRPNKVLLALLVFMLGAVAFRAITPRSKPEPVVVEGETMGTTYRVVLDANVSPKQKLRVKKAIDKLLAKINRQMSTYDPESEISRFNNSTSTEWVNVSLGFAKVVEEAKRIHEQSGGAFDVTVGPLVDLWGFGAKGRRDDPPTEEEIGELLDSLGSDRLEVRLSPASLRKSVGTLRVDLSAIAKGYAVDEVSTFLLSRAYRRHLVEIGGEVVARGAAPGGGPWLVGIETPTKSPSEGQRVGKIIRLNNRALATSGDYRNVFEADGRRFSHTIDPRDGQPVTHDLASVSVVAPTCALADALATTAMVLGPEKGLAMLSGLPDVEALLLVRAADGTFKEVPTAGMEALMAPLRSPAPR
ncbi:Thiamine biosynthesis lipoprotein ApbE precursor [Planctomycetes bacterium Pan216]|uniref:FAD:protein FMN transferase n=1 Tax=Kolteria novifilia TaxID=2527975 RepID=A0A518B520_9BACT|nr:Thiamine biosynthesis lipoprotein ApbE precursor [Planctomycetes bacterium Pan216]